MNISQISKEEIFTYDKDQIYEKKIILESLSEICIVNSKIYHYEFKSIINWFNFMLLTSYNTIEEIVNNIAEDICILGKVDGIYRLIYINVAFPNRWRPNEKINKDIRGIHQPIPNFENIAVRIEKFLEIMPENTPYRRSNWGFTKCKDLFLPFDKDDGTGIYLRKEIQTLIKVNNFIIFLIKTNLEKTDETTLKNYSNNLTVEMKDYKLLTSKL
jgi:hypothetical protein